MRVFKRIKVLFSIKFNLNFYDSIYFTKSLTYATSGRVVRQKKSLKYLSKKIILKASLFVYLKKKRI